MKPIAIYFLLLNFVGVVGACYSSTPTAPSAPAGITPSSLTVTSRSFSHNGAIPVDNSCDGADRSPQLSWSAVPAQTKSVAIVADDPDAQKGAFTHWVVFNIPSETVAVTENFEPGTLGARIGVNDFESARYRGPCPPRREFHRYFFRVFALDVVLQVPDGSTRETLYAAMGGHVLGAGYEMGTFSR